MLTSRGWWFLLLIVGLLATSLVGKPVQEAVLPDWRVRFAEPQTVGIIGMTLALWFAAQWIGFLARTLALRERISLERILSDDRGPVDTFWVGRPVHVRLNVSYRGKLRLPHIVLEDRIPFGVELRRGSAAYQGPLEVDTPIHIDYTVRCPSTGSIRFEGVRLRAADLQGFFYQRLFIPTVARYRVLASLVDARGRATATKRQNLLPPPGQHRHRRPGSGSELLDLRDYLPGDPPKTIAWKISARRDRLITKVFESEVPVRCTMFIDTSNSVRLGPPGQNALTGLVEIASAVAQATTGSRDLVGLCLFDEHQLQEVRPARGPRHLVRILNLLADAAGLAPSTGEAPPDALLPLAYGFCQDVYPELLEPDINRFPAYLSWLSPRPASTLRQPSVLDRLYGWLAYLLPVYIVGGFIAVFFTWVLVNWFLDKRLRLSVSAAFTVVILTAFLLALGFLRLPRYYFFPERRRLAAWRKKLAAVLCVRYGLAPGGLEFLQQDDAQFSQYLQRFLADHHVPYALPLYDRRGAYRFASPTKVQVLARALTRAVGKGRDNELFVLLADLLELTNALGPLLRSVKVALARHHRVMVVCPWPPGIPLPGAEAAPVPANGETTPAADGELRSALLRSTTLRFHQAFHEVRRTLGRLRVAVICAHPEDSPRIILERLELLRVLGKVR
jgi:uncharacterized protein (DUF58 family)